MRAATPALRRRCATWSSRRSRPRGAPTSASRKRACGCRSTSTSWTIPSTRPTSSASRRSRGSTRRDGDPQRDARAQQSARRSAPQGHDRSAGRGRESAAPAALQHAAGAREPASGVRDAPAQRDRQERHGRFRRVQRQRNPSPPPINRDAPTPALTAPPGMPVLNGKIAMADKNTINDWSGSMAAAVRASENQAARAFLPIAHSCR